MYHMATHANIPAMQNWINTLDPNKFEPRLLRISEHGTRHSKWPDHVPWPEAITAFHPYEIELNLDDAGYPFINLSWYMNMLGSWGLCVGPVSEPTPASQFDEHGSQTYLEISPGAYVWFME